MIRMTNGSKWATGAAVAIWFTLAGSAQARVFIVDDPYNPGEQLVVEFKGCRGMEARLERLLPLVKQQQTSPISIATAAPSTVAPSIRIAMTSRATRLPIVLGVGY